MSPVDIAIEIYSELCQEDGTGVSQNAIQYWLQNNIGKLNSKIYTSFIKPETSADPFVDLAGNDMKEEEKSIYKGLYYLKYYEGRIQYYTGAAGLQSIIELDSDGGRVKMINRNDLSKTYLSLRNNLQVELDDEINKYINKKCTPQDVSGDDIYSQPLKSNSENREIQ